MRITATHIVASIVGIVGVMGLYAHITAPDTAGHRVSEVQHSGMVEEVLVEVVGLAVGVHRRVCVLLGVR